MFCEADIRTVLVILSSSTVTPQTWDSYSNYNTLRAQADMASSISLRDAIDHTIAQVWFIACWRLDCRFQVLHVY